MKTNYLLTITSAFILAGCGSKSDTKQMNFQQKPTVSVIQLPVKDVVGQVSHPVSIEGIVNSEVRPKIQGFITGVFVDEGTYVRKGQLLFQLETNSLSEDARAAKANVDAAQVGVDQLKPLVEQKIISTVQLETAKAKLAQAKAAYLAVSANIGYARIVSPIDGYVGTIAYRQGSLVSPTTPLPITTISNTNEVYAYFSMNEGEYVDFLQQTPGNNLAEKIVHFPKVKLKMANGQIYKYDGTIHTVTAQIDPTTGSVSFRATFPNPEHLISNGSSGTIIIPKLYKNVTVVPAVSTYEQQGKTYVYELLKDSTVTPVIIDVQEQIDNIIVAGEGIKPGIEIVAKDAGKLRDKMKVKAIPTSFDSIAKVIVPVF